MSSQPQALDEEDDKERSRNLLCSVNLKPQAAGVHLEFLIYHAAAPQKALLKDVIIAADNKSNRRAVSHNT